MDSQASHTQWESSQAQALQILPPVFPMDGTMLLDDPASQEFDPFFENGPPEDTVGASEATTISSGGTQTRATTSSSTTTYESIFNSGFLGGNPFDPYFNAGLVVTSVPSTPASSQQEVPYLTPGHNPLEDVEDVEMGGYLPLSEFFTGPELADDPLPEFFTGPELADDPLPEFFTPTDLADDPLPEFFTPTDLADDLGTTTGDGDEHLSWIAAGLPPVFEWMRQLGRTSITRAGFLDAFLPSAWGEDVAMMILDEVLNTEDSPLEIEEGPSTEKDNDFADMIRAEYEEQFGGF